MHRQRNDRVHDRRSREDDRHDDARFAACAKREQMFDHLKLQRRTPSDRESTEDVAGSSNEGKQKSLRHERADTRGYCGLDPLGPRQAVAAAFRQRRDRDEHRLR